MVLRITHTLLFSALLALSIPKVQAQEFLASVQVNAAKENIAQSDKQVFQTLQTEVQQFINNRRWTEVQVAPNERIRISLFFNIESTNERNEMKSSLQVQITRPVYGSMYTSTLLSFTDEDCYFTYREFDPLDYQENQNLNDLTSLIAFYLNIALGVEFDSYGENAGKPYFAKAQNIVNTMGTTIGWMQTDGKGMRNRFYLAESFNNPRFAPIHELYYSYHREGMDQFHEDPVAGRAAISESLKALEDFNRSVPNSMIQKVFFQTKWPEIVEIYKGANPAEQASILKLLSSLDPSNTQRYEKIRS
ncbi:MAG: DUF4835 family protein [Bacteroidia bacterium]|jgi:hypothetical protein